MSSPSSPPGPAALSPARPVLATALAAAMQGVGGGLAWSVIPPLMPLLAQDLSISHAMGGVVWGAVPLGIALAAPLGGSLVDRLGVRRVAALGMVIGALACAARALAVGPWSMAAAMLAFGLHTGLVAPAIPKALAGHVPAKALGRANGTALLAYTLGTAVTVLVARTVLVPLFGGWRPLMVGCSAAMLVVAALWFALMRDRVALSTHAGLGRVLSLARNGQLLRVAAMQMLLFGGYLALLGLLPRSLTEAGLPPARVGAAVAAWLAAAALANLLGPWLSDRIGRRRPFAFGAAAIAGGALVVMALLPPAHAPILLIVAAMGGGALAPLLFTIPLELPGVGPERAGAALGLLMLLGQIGGFLLPVATGLAQQMGGFGAAVGLVAVLHLMLALPALGLTETGPVARAAADPPAAAPAVPASATP